jgi:hypothetical protein
MRRNGIFFYGLGVVVIVGAGAVLADEGDMHIPPGREVGFYWQVTDSRGYKWDLSSSGQVQDGSGNAYDSSPQLQIDGSSFGYGGKGRLSKDGQEVEIGPWTHNNVAVFRRIRIDKKGAYCRWVDVLTLRGQEKRTVRVRYYMNLGYSVRSIHTSSGKASIDRKKDWALVTEPSSSNSPTLVHVFGSRHGKLRPTVNLRTNSDNITYDFQLELTPNQPVALYILEAQRKDLAQAKAFLEAFDGYREIQTLPISIRKILANVSGAVLRVGPTHVARNPEHDLVTMRNADELLGSVLNDSLRLQTFFGPVDLPFARILGLASGSSQEDHVIVALTDGQIVDGTYLNPPLKMRLASGGDVSIPMTQLLSLGCAIDAAKPHAVAPKDACLLLRSGERLYYDPADVGGVFHTAHGPIALRADHVSEIHFQTPEGGLQQVIFRNGSVLSGLLEADHLRLKLDFGVQHDIPIHWINRLVVSSEPQKPAGLWEILLANGDTLQAQVCNEKLSILTASGLVEVRPEQLLRMQAVEGLGAGVKCSLRNGSVVTGKSETMLLDLKIQPGPALKVYTGQVTRLEMPEEPSESSEASSESDDTEAESPEGSVQEDPGRPGGSPRRLEAERQRAKEAVRKARMREQLERQIRPRRGSP